MSSSTSSLFYYLAAHVGACHTGDYVILLDGRRNRYFGVPASEAQILEREIEGWPQSPDLHPVGSADAHSAANELFDQLIKSGMLVRVSSPHVALRSPVIGAATAEIVEGYDHPSVKISIVDLLRFTRALVTAESLRRFFSVEEISKRFRDRRLRFDKEASAIDLERLRIHVAKFEFLLRPLLTRHNACLFRALALEEFLGYHRLTPNFVFGVSTNPFSAHCWLQHESYVLNDSPGNVSNYTPIFVV